MSASDTLQLGADAQITINVDDANGADLDLTAYDGYAVILLYASDGTVIEKYSSNTGITGYNSDDIDTSDGANGNIIIDFQRALSEAGRPDALVQHIIQVQSTDADYASSQFRDLTAPADTFRFGKVLTTTVDIS